MKNTLKILMILVIGIFLISSCDKDPDLNMPDLKKAVIAKINKDATKNMVIFDNNMAGFSGAITADLYWPNDKPKSMDLMVSLNDDPTKSVAVVSNITSWPVDYSFTVASLIDAIPNLDNVSQLASGDFFRFYANFELEDGTIINGNDTLYASYSSGIFNLPNSSPNVVYPVACGYEPSLAVGSYYSLSPSDQWNSSGDITITLDPVDNTKVYVTGIEEIEGLIEDVGPLVMHIDPMTFEVTADHSVIASDAWGYHNIAYEGTGTFNSCNGTYEMVFTISVDEGSFGANSFTFTRN